MKQDQTNLPKCKITFGKTERENDPHYSHIVRVFADGEQIGEIRKYRADSTCGEVACWNYMDDNEGESPWLTLHENLVRMKRDLKEELEEFYTYIKNNPQVEANQ